MDSDGTDVKAVTFAATALRISELAVFREAHVAWFDKPVSDERLMQSFHDYRVYGKAPFWVRHFTRQTLETTQQGFAPSHLENARRTLRLALELTVAWLWTLGYSRARKRVVNPDARFF